MQKTHLNNSLSGSVVVWPIAMCRAQHAALVGLGPFFAMRRLFAVPWLSSGGRIVLAVLAVAVLVSGALAFLKMNSGGKVSPAKELVTGSIRRSSTVNQPRDSMAALLAAPAVIQPVARTPSPTRNSSLIPLPRPRPKHL